uniref:Uncharacterized protein n=1 Tax=Lyophyllum shimeji TaxID=47721 RepID=A0A2Z4HH48_LYOSH|nr:hypothetical protein [Lyophyllum shimeji]AWW14108.1 hypothetical protein [Lyophyllum shimeji]
MVILILDYQINFDLNSPNLSDISIGSSVISSCDNKAIIISKNKSNIKQKFQLKEITIPFNEFTEIRFIMVLMLNLKLDSLNTLLFQYNKYSLHSRTRLLLF